VTKKHNVIIGKWGEEIASAFLQSKGLELLGQNHRTPHGEIDLIMKDGQTLVFVEVKTRTSTSAGYPEEGMNERKQKHLRDAIEYYFQENEPNDLSCRIDVISIIGKPDDNPPEILWFENALNG
jgi:putative endonuclease